MGAMNIETAARQSLYRQMRAPGGEVRGLLDRRLLRRIWTFSARHHRRLAAFVGVSVLSALLAVATPVLAGRVVDEIVRGGPASAVVEIALVIAVVALAETAVTLVTRWLSSTIGEGLILDLRTAVFDHVQKMPVAFFTRTRTGALVSRLGNDVVGAQRAFSDTLSGVVSNIVTLTLTLVVMLSISWQITVLALLLAPLFLLPARRIGRTMAGLSRESAMHNATMNAQMTERFSAPGATLIKLFGNPARESGEFALRADRVRKIGVKTSMLQATFMNSLTLMSALALALVYGLGGVLAIGGHLQAGAIVSLALLLTRLYAPLTALANAHVEIASALVSFERVFEVLDLVPLIREKPDAMPVPDGPVSRRVRRCPVLLPLGRSSVAGLARRCRGARRSRWGRGAARHLVRRRSGSDGGRGVMLFVNLPRHVVRCVSRSCLRLRARTTHADLTPDVVAGKHDWHTLLG